MKTAASSALTPAFNRRVFTTLGLAAALPVLSRGAQAETGLLDKARAMLGQQPTLRIALIDVSASPAPTDAAGLYRNACQRFFAQSKAGDEWMLVTVGEQGMDRVRPYSISVPRSGKTFEDRRHLKAAQESLATQLNQTLSLGLKDQRSRYIETLAALRAPTGRALGQGARVELAVLGDAMENSAFANFDFKPFDPAALMKEVARRDAMLLTEAPASEVRMMVIGAGGSSQAVYAKAETFWRSYASANHLTLAYYGTDLPPFWG